MNYWNDDLETALASGDPDFMKAMLARVPKDVLHRALPYIDQMARVHARNGKLEESLAYYDSLLEVMPDYVDGRTARAQVFLQLRRFSDARTDAARVAELAPDRAIGYRLLAEASEGLRELPHALAALRRAATAEPGDKTIEQRIRALEADIRKEAALRQAFDPDAQQEGLRIELPPLPPVSFDPALLDDPSIPPALENAGVDGLRQHLRHYSGQWSPKNAIARLEDPAWLAAWDAALATTTGSSIVFRGSELGVFALRALRHGARRALCLETFPLEARIATGMVQKHFLAPWYARHGAAIQGWSEEERRASFEEFAAGIDVALASGQPPEAGDCDCFVFPQIDHSLLGTGIVKAIRQHCGAGKMSPARILPAKAAIFAMGIQWTYPGTDFRLEPMNRLRWSMYPQTLDLDSEFWAARTEAVRVGEIDFANFLETTWEAVLPVTAGGSVDAIVYWFELDLGDVKIGNAPGGELQCIRPAVQYTDPIEVQAAGVVHARVHVRESRLYFQTLPAATQRRTHGLPGWYVPMLGDRRRNDAYRNAIAKALAAHPADIVFDIGAGCGLLSMKAAQAGAERVVGCETHRAILEAGREIVALNGLDERITLIHKDCREMSVPDDLPRRADLAVFELFDCSLIGEGILHFLAHAREHLLAENARYLPVAARIRAMVIEYRLDRIWDVDANLLNPYRASLNFINVDASKLAYRALSEPFDVFAFDFASAGPAPEEKESRLPAIAPGTAGAVLFWFDLQLDETTWISNDPAAENALHWKQGLQFLPEVQVEAGSPLPLAAKHDGSSLRFHWLQEEMRKEAFSRLPRLDPRWVAANGELEQQTRGLLQHCTQNPEEYSKVAEIAKRFAIDPAAHGIDPAIAQRFASMFFHDA
ncbi:MAG TPA: 50S ribosomal protein L11 methyltransferase [Paucimonas sp.]|nr:50S ribosomal protein L11 methyltransferase [Paucimonas sp.]